MLKSISRWFSRNSQSITYSKKVVPETLSLPHEAKGALKVVEVLQEAGYEAYMVGGCVRDLLAGIQPKDFDVATNATPEQIKPLFRRARIIGRRFQLVHVLIARSMIEVATFRGGDTSSLTDTRTRIDQEGRITKDNTWGSLEDDVKRRDFTINALYYNPTQGEIIDFTQGLKDIKSGVIRLIGDPLTRYREDPVRMIRALRFQAKLGYSIEKDTLNTIQPNADLLSNVPAARMFDEVLKLFLSGHAVKTFEALVEANLFQQLFPTTSGVTDNLLENTFLRQTLADTDERLSNRKKVSPAFLYAALLYPYWRDLYDALIAEKTPPIPACHQAAQKTIEAQAARVQIPKRFSMGMKEIWELQIRLRTRSPKKSLELVAHPRFRAGYDFILLREKTGEHLDGLGKYWTQFQKENPPPPPEPRADRPSYQKKRRRRRPPNQQRSNNSEAS